jgi:hypothetical protein
LTTQPSWLESCVRLSVAELSVAAFDKIFATLEEHEFLRQEEHSALPRMSMYSVNKLLEMQSKCKSQLCITIVILRSQRKSRVGLMSKNERLMEEMQKRLSILM